MTETLLYDGSTSAYLNSKLSWMMAGCSLSLIHFDVPLPKTNNDDESDFVSALAPLPQVDFIFAGFVSSSTTGR